MGELEDMTVFSRVVESGGISRAAEQLGLAKSAVSRRLADLERRLGVKLLNRTTRAIHLTDVGKLYYERVIKVLDDVAELNTITTDINTSLAGTLRLSAPVSFGIAHLSSAISDFTKHHPQLNINISFSDRHIDLVEEGFDLAIRIGDLHNSNLKARKITTIRLAVCASPTYLAEHGTPTTPDDLKQHKLLQYAGSNANAWKFITPSGEDYYLSINASLLANNGDFLHTMAINGHGIILSPTFIVWQSIKRGDLVCLLSDYAVPTYHAYAVYPQTRYLSQRARKFIDFLTQRFSEKPYWDKGLN